MIFSSLSKYKNAGLLIMRIGIGLAMTLHGYPKLSGGSHKWAELGMALGPLGIHFLPVFWGFMAAVSEFFGGILVILGLGFRWACIFIGIVLAVALTGEIKAGGGFSDFSHAYELLVVFLSLFIIGPGRYSVDKI